jgi:TerC family integral membrane protein
MLAAATEAATNYAEFDVPAWVWLAFLAGFSTLLLVDVLVIHREARVVSMREAAIESAVWISIGLSFTFVILAWQGGQAAGEYLAGYLIEESLSVDNVFVWALILTYFVVPRQYQHRVLFWGIFGALIFRAIFIFGGVALLERFDWVIYVFGVILLITAVRLITSGDEEIHPEHNPVLRAFRRVVPSTSEYDGHKLFTRESAKRLATPLFAVLVVVETSDVVFAVDSIPAILAVTRETFVVYTSNAFAILGLRALYFLLADLKDRFHYLRYGLAVILAFVAVKMLLSEWFHVPVGLSLAVIAVILTVSVVVSMRHGQEAEPATEEAPDPL